MKHVHLDRSTHHEHPGPVMYTCDFCGQEWRNPISAAMCCDMAAPGPADDDHQSRPRYELGYD